MGREFGVCRVVQMLADKETRKRHQWKSDALVAASAVTSAVYQRFEPTKPPNTVELPNGPCAAFPSFPSRLIPLR